jgi:zinc-dependent metalloproteinase lipoprotein
MKLLRQFVVIIIFLSVIRIYAQQPVTRCLTDEVDARYLKTHPSANNRIAFEAWLAKKMNQLKKNAAIQKTNETVYKIPVVVHIIHNGETIGTGSNISDERILSQIQVLNQDFRRKNADTVNTRAPFLPVAADCNIEFVLAVTDPDGVPTTGIRRVKGSKTDWNANSDADNVSLKATDYWDSRYYFNIWVCNLSDGTDPSAVLGYAQYPESDLPGLRDQDLGNTNKNPLTDGVVINYRYFGINTHDKYGKGRTTTHEVGHYLGLYHPWGSSSGKIEDCSDTDYCDDTPKTGKSYFNCQTTAKACDGIQFAMVENYMDYSDDACFNIFTLTQKTRMRAVLENSPRRKTLLTSPGLIPAPPVPNDAGIRAVITPADQIYCESQLTPRVVLRNYGSNALTQVTLKYQIDNSTLQTLNYTGNLATYTNDTLNLQAFALTTGSHTFKVFTSTPNGTTDTRKQNDTLTTIFEIGAIRPIPFEITFGETTFPPAGWSIYNPDYGYSWERITLTDSVGVKDTVIYVNCFDYTGKGEKDFLYSSSYDFSDINYAELQFDVSYAQYNGSSGAEGKDGLQVLISKDCGNTYTKIYEKRGDTLKTVRATGKAWTPTYVSHWRTERQSLKDYLNEKNVKLAFVAINDYGNNIYLNNIKVSTLSIKDELFVYPNPSVDGTFNIILNLKEKQQVTLTLYDNLGRKVFSNAYNDILQGSIVLPVPQLASGLYILKASGSSFSGTKRISVQK